MFGAGAAIGAVSQMNSDIMSYFTAKEAAKTQARRAESMFRNRYRWTVKDLEKAGLNKMLAFGAQPPIASPQGFAPNIKGGYAAAAQAGAEASKTSKTADLVAENITADTNLKREESVLNEAKESQTRTLLPFQEASARADAFRARQEAMGASIQRELLSLALPGARAMASAQASEDFRDALKFNLKWGNYSEPAKGLLNFSVFGGAAGNPFSGKAGATTRRAAGFR